MSIINKYIDEIVEENIKNDRAIGINKIRNILYSKYGEVVQEKDIEDRLKKNKNLIVLVKERYVSKDQLINFLLNNQNENISKRLEEKFCLEFEENDLKNILHFIDQNNLLTINEREVKEDFIIEEITFEKVLRKGLECGFVSSSLLKKIDYEKENIVHDFFEAFTELENKEIKVITEERIE